jgi:SAM-dependent methyltransferase
VADELVPHEVFEEEVYDHFYRPVLEEASDAQAELIAELAELGGGEDVLDVPCGDGRIAVRLAAKGCRVVGVDSSERFIANARARPRAELVRFETGDMRRLSYEAEFDCVLNWFTSFGYFDRETNSAVLHGFHRALRPGGRLLLELRNPALLHRKVELGGGYTAHVEERSDDLLVDRVTLDGSRSHTERWVVRGGGVRKLEFWLELYDGDGLLAALAEAGFADISLFDERAERFSSESRRLIAVARA